jgi:ferredoxin
MRLIANAERCVSCGQCVVLAPTVFNQDDSGLVVLLKGEPGADEADAVAEALLACPSGAIAAAAAAQSAEA